VIAHVELSPLRSQSHLLCAPQQPKKTDERHEGKVVRPQALVEESHALLANARLWRPSGQESCGGSHVGITDTTADSFHVGGIYSLCMELKFRAVHGRFTTP